LPETERAEALKKYDEMLKSGDTQSNGLLGGRSAGGGMGGAGGPPPGAGGPPGGPDGGSSQRGNNSAVSNETRKSLWILEPDGSVSLKNVTVGASDASNTEIVNGADLVGKAAILRAQ